MYSFCRSHSGGLTSSTTLPTRYLYSPPCWLSFNDACGSPPPFGLKVMMRQARFWLTGSPLTVKEISVGRGDASTSITEPFLQVVPNRYRYHPNPPVPER